MPRFYFDVLNGREVHRDPEGQEFADQDAALADAAASAQYLVAHGMVDYDAKRNGFKQTGFACLFQAL